MIMELGSTRSSRRIKIKTWQTQPALLAASVAIFRVWQEKYPQLQPSVMAGHSLGEYSALVCAGVIDFKDAIKLVELDAVN